MNTRKLCAMWGLALMIAGLTATTAAATEDKLFHVLADNETNRAFLRSAAQGSSDLNPVAEAYGLVDTTTVALAGMTFVPITAVYANAYAQAVGTWCNSSCVLAAHLDLPSGARVTGIELTAHDTDANGQVEAYLLKCPSSSLGCEIEDQVSTGASETPGTVTVPKSFVYTALNSAFYHTVMVVISGGTSGTSLVGFRVYYKRQISPAPGVATFSDVPNGHTFYAGVEALAASGITGGCGGGKFCPNDPVTRGQMATFLARALGLHWEN